MKTTIAFTVCTASHLGQAKTMADSLTAYNPAYKVIIGLVGQVTKEIDISFFCPHVVLPVEEMLLGCFTEMKIRYSQFCLTVALKPFYANYLIKKYQPANLIYLDSDTFVLNSFEHVDKLLDTNSIVITPHILSPYPKGERALAENSILNAGTFNSGFFALKNDDTAVMFLDWWKDRMRDMCYIDPPKGLFVDQIWLNFVPLFYKNVHILTHMGYNVAYWNLHERSIGKQDGKYIVNNDINLVFYHFSGYSVYNPDKIGWHKNPFNLFDIPQLHEIFNLYYQQLIKNRQKEFLALKYTYKRRPPAQHFLNKLSFNTLYRN